jgi:hypothetical protein
LLLVGEFRILRPKGKDAAYVVKADEPVRAGPHGATAACMGDDCVMEAESTGGEHVRATAGRAARRTRPRNGIRNPAIERIATGDGRFSMGRRSGRRNTDRDASRVGTR